MAQTTETVLRSLLDEQAKKALEISSADDIKTLTKKFLKKKEQSEIDGIWSCCNPMMLGQPLTWYYLIHEEAGQACVAINASLAAFPQAHMCGQLHKIIMAVAAVCALIQADKVSIFEGFTIAEPLLLLAFEAISYLKAKKIADAHRLTSADTNELISLARVGEKGLESKLEAQARKLKKNAQNGKRQRSKSRSRS